MSCGKSILLILGVVLMSWAWLTLAMFGPE